MAPVPHFTSWSRDTRPRVNQDAMIVLSKGAAVGRGPAPLR